MLFDVYYVHSIHFEIIKKCFLFYPFYFFYIENLFYFLIPELFLNIIDTYQWRFLK